MNKVFISGNLTRDPELRATQGGTSILGLGVAVNERRRNAQTGEWEDHANFVDCNLFGRRAEALAPMLRKGSKVCVEGRLRFSSWEDRQTGQRRTRLDVTVDEIELLSRQDGARRPAAGAQPDEEIPF